MARDDVVLTLNAVDADLIERWRKRKKPFDGVTLVLPWPGVPLDQLRADIRLVIADLQPRAGGRIETLEDWHEHDGYVKPGMAVDWASITDALDSDEAFLRLWPGDTFVRRGYTPEHRDWYLRIWFDDDDTLDAVGRPTRGAFDLTCQPDLATSISSRMPGLEQYPAADFFDRGYAG